MPGFRPNEHYLREMQRFGILPRDLKPTDPVDPYATDRAYWKTFVYLPVPPTLCFAGKPGRRSGQRRWKLCVAPLLDSAEPYGRQSTGM